MSQFQGKESTDIPEHVYDKILVELKKARLFDLSKIKVEEMRKILKKLDAPNAHIRKNEEERIIDSLRHMINENYIKKSNGTDNRSKMHNAFIELLE